MRFFAISEPAWIANFAEIDPEADSGIFRDFKPQLYTVWNFGRGLTQAEAGERLGVTPKTIQRDGQNGHLAEMSSILGPDWNEKVPTHAQIGERIGWSREQVRNYGFVLDKVGTRILEMAKTHQEGRVPENGTRVTFTFTEGWFRNSGMYRLWPEYQVAALVGVDQATVSRWLATNMHAHNTSTPTDNRRIGSPRVVGECGRRRRLSEQFGEPLDVFLDWHPTTPQEARRRPTTDAK